VTDGTATAERERTDPADLDGSSPGEDRQATDPDSDSVDPDSASVGPESGSADPERDGATGIADDLDSLVDDAAEAESSGDRTGLYAEALGADAADATPGLNTCRATRSAVSESATEETLERVEETVERDGRWRAGLLFALAAGSAGVVVGNTAVFLSAIVGLVYSGYATMGAPPDPSLVVDRSIDDPSPAPGDTVTVTVTVRNAGSSVLPDVRVADRPPAGLTVVRGETRQAATVEPGETVAFSYAVCARRGKHRFSDVVTVARTASGATARREVHATAVSMVCYAPFEALELAEQAGPGTGRVETDTGGEGVEFYATRRYDPSDPVSRIDWNRYAATGELSTVVYRETRAATVVFVVDGRHDLRRRAEEPSAVALGAYATVRVADALLAESNDVGVAVLDDEGDPSTPSGRYLRPASGEDQSLRVRRLLEDAFGVSVDDLAGGDDDPTDAGPRSSTAMAGRLDRFRTRFPDDAQVVYVSPLLDGRVTYQIERLAAHGHATTVLSPNVTDTATAGQTVEHVERAERVRLLRSDTEIRVVDWSLDESLQAAVTRDSAGWDR